VSDASSYETSPVRALPASAFLACSWTWCVGMWLPVYLISDFGSLGWLCFAVPNVVGAASVGFVHRTRKAVDDFSTRGLEAMRWFSVVTILFHLGFLGWMTREHAPPVVPDTAAYGVAPLALLFGAALSLQNSRTWGMLAMLTVPVAPLLMIAALSTTGGQALSPPPASGTVTDPAALPLYSVGLAFGFLLCPHLDLSILRARREHPGAPGDAAFLVGFGGLFLMMIGLTALYAGGILLGWFSSYLLAHFFLQGTFTIGAHLREMRTHGWPRLMGPFPLVVFLILAAGCVALTPITEFARLVADKPNSRMAYESFIWFYALPFPAAAWFLLRKRRLGTAFWASVGLATPAMTAGALFGVWWAIPIAVAVPLLAIALAPKTASARIPTAA